MLLLKKIIIFLIIFSFVFYFVRTNQEYSSRILVLNIGGVAALFGAVSTIFGLLAAFAIQKEWEMWNALADAVNGEVDSLEKLYLWSTHFPEKIKQQFHENIKLYTELVVKFWHATERGEKTPEVTRVLETLNDNIYSIFNEEPRLMPTTFTLFSNLLQRRSDRIEGSMRRMPHILKNTLQYASFLLIFLSMFVGINNIWLAFLFTASIASLAFSIFVVLIDLDNPLKPGSWHITTSDYESLLARIESYEKKKSLA